MAGAPEGAKNGPKEWEAGIPQTQPAKHSAFSAAEVPFEIQLQLHSEEEGDKRNQRRRGEGVFKFPTKTEDGGEEAEEKERKRAIEGSGVSGRASERGCSSGASPPTVRDLHRLSFISACPS